MPQRVPFSGWEQGSVRIREAVSESNRDLRCGTSFRHPCLGAVKSSPPRPGRRVCSFQIREPVAAPDDRQLSVFTLTNRYVVVCSRDLSYAGASSRQGPTPPWVLPLPPDPPLGGCRLPDSPLFIFGTPPPRFPKEGSENPGRSTVEKSWARG